MTDCEDTVRNQALRIYREHWGRASWRLRCRQAGLSVLSRVVSPLQFDPPRTGILQFLFLRLRMLSVRLLLPYEGYTKEPPPYVWWYHCELVPSKLFMRPPRMSCRTRLMEDIGRCPVHSPSTRKLLSTMSAAKIRSVYSILLLPRLQG